jgi:hypothetical protein
MSKINNNSVKDLAYLDWLYPLKYGISNRDEVIKTDNYKKRLDYETYCIGYTAAITDLQNEFYKLVEELEAAKSTLAAVIDDVNCGFTTIEQERIGNKAIIIPRIEDINNAIESFKKRGIRYE